MKGGTSSHNWSGDGGSSSTTSGFDAVATTTCAPYLDVLKLARRGERVVSTDELTGVQALERLHPGLPVGRRHRQASDGLVPGQGDRPPERQQRPGGELRRGGDRSLHRLTGPGAGVQDRRVADQGATRPGGGGSRAEARRPEVPQRADRRWSHPAGRAWPADRGVDRDAAAQAANRESSAPGGGPRVERLLVAAPGRLVPRSTARIPSRRANWQITFAA